MSRTVKIGEQEHHIPTPDEVLVTPGLGKPPLSGSFVVFESGNRFLGDNQVSKVRVEGVGTFAAMTPGDWLVAAEHRDVEPFHLWFDENDVDLVLGMNAGIGVFVAIAPGRGLRRIDRPDALMGIREARTWAPPAGGG